MQSIYRVVLMYESQHQMSAYILVIYFHSRMQLKPGSAGVYNEDNYTSIHQINYLAWTVEKLSQAVVKQRKLIAFLHF